MVIKIVLYTSCYNLQVGGDDRVRKDRLLLLIAERGISVREEKRERKKISEVESTLPHSGESKTVTLHYQKQEEATPFTTQAEPA